MLNLVKSLLPFYWSCKHFKQSTIHIYCSMVTFSEWSMMINVSRVLREYLYLKLLSVLMYIDANFPCMQSKDSNLPVPSMLRGNLFLQHISLKPKPTLSVLPQLNGTQVAALCVVYIFFSYLICFYVIPRLSFVDEKQSI